MQANLTRLVDLTAELFRRLKPLGRAAEVARRAATIQADLRDSRLRLLADNYMTLAARLATDEADEAAVLARRTALETSLGEARRREAELDTAAQQHAAALAQAQETWFGLSSLAERLRSTAGLAKERHRHLSAEPVAERPGRDPDELDRQAAELRDEEDTLSARLAVGRERLTTAVAERSGAEAELARLERRMADDTRAAATRADRLAKLRGQVGAASSRQAAAAEELDRLAAAAAEARVRAERAQAEHRQAAAAESGHDEDRAELADAHGEATARLAAATAEVGELRKTEAEAIKRFTALQARVDTLQEAFRRGADASADRWPPTAGSAASSARSPRPSRSPTGPRPRSGRAGRRRQRRGRHRPERGHRHPHRAARVRRGHGRAGHRRSPGRGSLGGVPVPVPVRPPGSPAGASYALDLVQASDELRPAVTQLLGGVVVAASLEQAADLMRATPGQRVVTRDGDVLGAHWATGGSAGQQSLIEVRAAADDAATGLQATRTSARTPPSGWRWRSAPRPRPAGPWTRPGPGCARPTRPRPRSPAASAAWPAPPAPPGTRSGGWRPRSRPPATRGRRTRPGWPS